MYVVVEAWTPKPAFLTAPPTQRADFFAALDAGIAALGSTGVEPLGWGRTDPSGEHGSEHDWFAVWQVRDAAAADTFLAGVLASGWYDYFEQTNLRGELRPVADVVREHIGLAS